MIAKNNPQTKSGVHSPGTVDTVRAPWYKVCFSKLKDISLRVFDESKKNIA